MNINKKNQFTFIGGDLRTVKLIEMLSKEENIIYTFGLEKAEELKDKNNIIFCSNLNEALDKSDIVICPIPFSSDDENLKALYSEDKITIKSLSKLVSEKIVIAGNISANIVEEMTEVYKAKKVIDIMKNEELTILNTIATAEGTIATAILNTDKILHDSEILILGFGRVAKTLAKKLSNLSTNVTCAVRKKEDIAWIVADGYKYENINKLENIEKYDIIINTVPTLILKDDDIKKVNKECLIIDLASAPGGVDRQSIQKNNIKFIWALALPGKVAPLTSAKFIKETINNILKEIDK